MTKERSWHRVHGRVSLHDRRTDLQRRRVGLVDGVGSVARAGAGADSIRRIESREEPDRRPHVGGVVVRVRRGRGRSGAHGVVLLAKSIGSAKTKARIWMHGTATEATVASVEETNVKINRRPMWVVCYQYRDHTGQAREGKSHYMSVDTAHAWKMGDRVPIRYDRDKPDLSAWLS